MAESAQCTRRVPRPSGFADLPARGHVVIEASAGTGKTWTIEHLLVDLIVRGQLDVGQILVVTFTVRATQELRIRVRQTLERLLYGNDADAPNPTDDAAGYWVLDREAKSRLKAALVDFDSAPIYTIHAFCQRVLRDYAFLCGRPLELEVVDPGLVFRRAFHSALRTRLATKSELRDLLAQYLARKSVAALEESLAGAARLQGERRPHLDRERIARLCEAAHATGALLRRVGPEALAEGLDRLQLHPIDRLDREALLIALNATLRGFSNERWPTLLAALDDMRLELITDPRPVRVGAWEGRTFTELASGDVGELVSLVDALSNAAVPIGAAAAQWFLPEIQAEIDDLKEREGWIDHDDALLGVKAALGGIYGNALRRALRDRYRVALIDEFQDTDITQWEIFESLFVTGTDDHRLFIIGDPKQAIYSFRGGDIATYIYARDRLRGDGAPLTLENNYRSTGDLIDGLNLVFDQRADPPFFAGDIRYDAPVTCAKTALRLVSPVGARLSPVVLVAAEPDRRKLTGGRLRERIGEAMAREIRRLVDGEIGQIEDGDSTTAIAASDIFVLVRSGWEAAHIAEFLEAQGVPFVFFKRDGLFQTKEAKQLRDLLDAIAAPGSPQRRARAWYTPFFALELRDLLAGRELAETHPAIARLYAWNALAADRNYEELFAEIARESRLVERELLTNSSERRLTNMLHLLELMADEGSRTRTSMSELVRTLDAYIEGRERPQGVGSDVQRLESDRDAVQIMTIHKAKGLEASVVFVYGGFGRTDRAPWIYHLQPETEASPPRRIVALEKPIDPAERELLKRELRGDNERLLYVALTRAKARVYLPFYRLQDLNPLTQGSAVHSSYEVLRQRLETLVDEGAFGHLATTIQATEDQRQARPALSAWRPPAELVLPFDPSPPPSVLRRRRHLITSYSAIKAGDADENWEFAPAAAVRLADKAVPGGPVAGGFLHELLERVDFDPLKAPATGLDEWRADPDTSGVFDDAFGRWQLPIWCRADAERLVHSSLTSPVALGDHVLEGVASATNYINEMEFTFPLPEPHHPPLDAALRGGRITIDRGWVKGFIDVIFEADERLFFLDWKSDVLPSYQAHHIEEHVSLHYGWQARLYTLALVKMLDIASDTEYEARFGGYLYVFLRGTSPDAAPGTSMFSRRPAWDEVLEFEQELIAKRL